MAIVRYNPWSEMDSVQRQINRVFNDVFTTQGGKPVTPANFIEFGNYSKYPAAELIETTENLILKLEVPGMQAADINIEATAKSVSVSGERKSESETIAEDKQKTRTEFRYGSFARVIPLPVRIQNTEVKAEYTNGILTLTLPKAYEEKNKVVKISLQSEVDR